MRLVRGGAVSTTKKLNWIVRLMQSPIYRA